MHVLLPPSETKRLGGESPYLPEALAHHDRLARTRAKVRGALVAASRTEREAVRALKLGAKNRDERRLNLALGSRGATENGAMPAIERYTGVLYDALDVRSLGDDERQWIDAQVFIQSALFGLVSAADPIPAYRLSGSSRLPRLEAPLARIWAPVHEELLGDGAGEASAGRPRVDYALDLRSKDYAALAPVGAFGAAAFDVVEVVARGADGEVRALNHFNKTAKGELVRRLARSRAEIGGRGELLDWAADAGVELLAGDDPHIVRLVTEQIAPARKQIS